MIARSIIVALLVGVVGCREDTVRTTRVPKPEPVKLRTLAALVPRADAVWFFKLSGPESAVADDEEKFNWFLGSVLFGDDPPVRYATPEGWKYDAGGGKARGGMVERFATLRTPNGNEAIITKLGPESAEVLPNINRWRREVGLGPITPEELPTCTKEFTVGGAKAVWTDLRNDGQQVTAAPPPIVNPHAAVPEMKAPATPPPPSNSGVKFDTPPGWLALPASGIRVAAFRMGEGSESAECTLIPLGGPAGGVTNNINRWRVELRLEELDDAKLKATLKELVVEGKPCPYCDLLAPEGPKRQRTLGVIVTRGATTWFVKLRGHADTVGKNQAAFETFARSLKLPAGE